jgi:hypothetical protein
VIRIVAEMVLAHSTGCSCDFQRTMDVFQSRRRRRRILTALALGREVWRYRMGPAGSMQHCASMVVELDRDHALEESGGEVNKGWCGIAVTAGLNDKDRTKADTELHADNCQTMQSAGYR